MDVKHFVNSDKLFLVSGCFYGKGNLSWAFGDTNIICQLLLIYFLLTNYERLRAKQIIWNWMDSCSLVRKNPLHVTLIKLRTKGSSHIIQRDMMNWKFLRDPRNSDISPSELKSSVHCFAEIVLKKLRPQSTNLLWELWRKMLTVGEMLKKN